MVLGVPILKHFSVIELHMFSVFRERTMLKELMHALLLQLANDRWRLDLDVTTLKSELLHAIKGQARSSKKFSTKQDT